MLISLDTNTRDAGKLYPLYLTQPEEEGEKTFYFPVLSSSRVKNAEKEGGFIDS